jgi:heme oxygenase
MEELKAATFPAHARLQTAPFFSALAACQLPLESYVGQLRVLAVIHGVLETALANCQNERVASVWQADMRKLPLLREDLGYFDPRVVADLKEAVDAALFTAESLRSLSVAEPLALLGAIYVLEGSTLGAGMVRPMVARALLLTSDEGLAYLHSYGAAVHQHWAQFQTRMNAMRLNADERAQVIRAASDFFQQLEKIFRALYPFAPESKTFTVTAINPEAGRHAVPANPIEVAAALRAGNLCWNQFPYFEQRYGERGRRFAQSDAAWQATLYQFAPAQISQQVRWLGRVLAGRGMPTWLLEVQLGILVRELSAAIPEKKSEYETLLPAAAELQALRRKHFSDEDLSAIAAEFDCAVGPEWAARLPRAGALLGCAVADELNGSDLAVESLRSWLTDAARFPATWIAAVEAALVHARALARRPHNKEANEH